MPMTRYVTRGSVAVATDSSEACGVFVTVGLSEFSETVSIGGELLVANSAVGVSATVGLSEFSETVSIGGELLVANSAVGVFVTVGLSEFSETVSIGGGELLVANLAVAGIGDAATDEVFG
jgi:hypothetical protein